MKRLLQLFVCLTIIVVMGMPTAISGASYEERPGMQSPDDGALAEEPEDSNKTRAMRVLWERIDRNEVSGAVLEEKALDNLAEYGSAQARAWVAKERKRREDAELAELDRAAERADKEELPPAEEKAPASVKEETPPSSAHDYEALSSTVDVEGDMVWASSEGMSAPIEFPEIVEFFLKCLAKPWQQAVGIQRMTYTNPPQPAQLVRGPIFFRPVIVSAEAMRTDGLLARKTIKAAVRGIVSSRKDWTPPGADLLPPITPIPPNVFPAQRALEALYKKDSNEWTRRAESFWEKHNSDESHQPETLYEEAVQRWFIKKKGPKGTIKSFAPIAWYVALASGTTANHNDSGAYKTIFTTESAYGVGGARTPYQIAVFNNLQRYFHHLLQKIFVDTHASKDAGTP